MCIYVSAPVTAILWDVFVIKPMTKDDVSIAEKVPYFKGSTEFNILLPVDNIGYHLVLVYNCRNVRWYLLSGFNFYHPLFLLLLVPPNVNTYKFLFCISVNKNMKIWWFITRSGPSVIQSTNRANLWSQKILQLIGNNIRHSPACPHN